MTPPNVRALEDLETRLRFETLLADISSQFTDLAPGDVDREILNAQDRICDLLGLDVSAIWQWLPEQRGLFTLTHLYRRFEGRRGARPDERLRVFSLAYCPVAGRESGRLIVHGRVYPQTQPGRESLEYYGIKSLLHLPLWAGTGAPLWALLHSSSTLEEHAGPGDS